MNVTALKRSGGFDCWALAGQRLGFARRRVVAVAILSLLPTLAVLCSGNRTSSPTKPDRVESFKAFVSSPPVIEELVYRKKLPPDLHRPPPMETGLQGSTNYQFMHARWQTNGLFWRELSELSDLSEYRLQRKLVIRSDRRFWFLDSVQAIVGDLDDPASSNGKGPTSHLNLILDTELRKLGEVLNFGVFHLPPASIRWQGDEFATEAKLALTTIQIRGKLARTPDGLPASLGVEYRNDQGIATYSIRYSYTTNVGLPFFPNQWRVLWLRNGREIEMGEVSLLRLGVGEEPLPLASFDASAFIRTNRSVMRYYTNHMLYAANRLGQLVPLPVGVSPGDTLNQPSLATHRYFYLVIAGLTIGFFLRVVRMKRSTNRNDRTERKYNEASTQ